jgi:hypothetical protein
VAALLLLAGCARLSLVPLDREMAKPQNSLTSGEGMSITGYVTRDGAYHPYRGRVGLDGDTLVFHGAPSNRGSHSPEHRVAAAEVTTLFNEKLDAGMVVGMSAAVLLGCFVVVAAVGITMAVGMSEIE